MRHTADRCPASPDLASDPHPRKRRGSPADDGHARHIVASFDTLTRERVIGSDSTFSLNKTPDFRLEWVDAETSRSVWVAGEVDLATVVSLRGALDCQQPRLIVDLSHVTFMDLSGLGCLLEAVTRGKVVALHTSPRVDRLLQLTATRHLFEVN
jgi:anti-anti-sigma factor